MRLNHSCLRFCILLMLGIHSSGASAPPLAPDTREMAMNEMDYRQYAPDIQQRGQPTATGNCRRRGQGDGTSSRKVRLQHANVNVQQKMAASSSDEQKSDTKPQQLEKTVDPNGQDNKLSQAQSQQAAPSSTGTGSSDQHADKSDSHGEVPSVQVPALKQGQTAGKPSGGDMVIQQKMQNELVRLHNLIRQENGVGAVQWDDKLAEYSAGWMKNCLFEHSGGDGYGENLGANSGKEVTTAVDMVRGWANEQSNFHCKKADSTEEFEGIGHYTAMMWKDVQYIGCSLQKCASVSSAFDGAGGWIWSCNYWPAPNMGSPDPKVDNYALKVPCNGKMPDALKG